MCVIYLANVCHLCLAQYPSQSRNVIKQGDDSDLGSLGGEGRSGLCSPSREASVQHDPHFKQKVVTKKYLAL